MSRQARLTGTGSFLPGERIDNATLERLLGPLPEEVLEGLQVKTRHWATDPATGDMTRANSEMAHLAAEAALADAGRRPDEVGLVVVSTASPDYHLPAVASLVQERLGLERAAVIDLRAGCTGPVIGLDIARRQLEAGLCDVAVVIGSETISPLLVPLFRGRDPELIRMRDRIPGYVFGDGAGAMVVEAAEVPDAKPPLIGPLATRSIGGLRKPGLQVIGGGTHAPLHVQLAAPRLVEIKVDVVESERFTPNVLEAGLADLLQRSNVHAGDLDACVVPEGNAGYLVERIRSEGLELGEWSQLAGRIVENLAEVGATGSAAVPLAVDDARRRGRLRAGERVALLGIETSKWLYAGLVVTLP